MPERKKKRSRERREQPAEGLRAFWSGTITFGLVTIPVDLVAATRSGGISMRMLDRDSGEPLSRQYYCPEHEEALERDDIVRGFDVDGGYVMVKDQELEAIAPRKSRDIELVRFVDADEVDPLHFRRGYFLLPSGDSSKAYHLLASTMERAHRAGIATFVMRGREYPVAILSEQGVLRAETLRFADELRTPEDLGLPELDQAPPARVRALVQQIEKLESDQLDPGELEDRGAEAVVRLARKKLGQGKDVVQLAQQAAPLPPAQVVDLMELIKQRMGISERGARRARPKRASRARKAGSRPRRSSRSGKRA